MLYSRFKNTKNTDFKFAVHLEAKTMIYAYFPEKFSICKNWLFFKIYDFEIDYIGKNEFEEYRVHIRRNSVDNLIELDKYVN
jgi:hypothetical protein